MLHISPSHHFPSGIVMSNPRRQALLGWAAEQPDRWIIEDDYDSEFRFNAHPLPALHTLNGGEKVIYLNTFSKTLAPSIRISYMVLPKVLMDVYRKNLGFYSCTVPSFEQHTLERFISRGFFEKHINRMRKSYKSIRNRVLAAITGCSQAAHFTILEEHAGLHFLLQVDLPLTDAQLTEACRKLGLRVAPLSSYYRAPEENSHCLVINYSGLTEQTLVSLEKILQRLSWLCRGEQRSSAITTDGQRPPLHARSKLHSKKPPHIVGRKFFHFLSSSGTKSRVMESTAGRSWIYLTPAASIIRLDANVLGVVAYLSDR